MGTPVLRLIVTTSIAATSFACGADPAGPAEDAGTASVDAGSDAGTPDAGASPRDERYANTLSSPSDLADLADPSSDGAIKYLLAVEGRTPPAPLDQRCYFQNARMFPWHIQFLNSFEELEGLSLEAFEQLVLRPESRALWGGSLQVWPGGIMSFTVYAAPDTLTVEDIAAVDGILDACVPFARDLLAFLPGDPYQKLLARTSQDALTQLGVRVVFAEDLLRGVPYQSYSKGEGYGTLLVVPHGQPLVDYGIRDVVVVETAPNDISVVAGLVTADPQSLHSHVNLRLVEKGIPNAAVPDVYDDPFVLGLDGSLVRIVVDDDGVRINPARLEDAQRFWDANRPTTPPTRADLDERDLEPFGPLRADRADAYGVKAANLGELHGVLSEDNRTEGFAIPFSAYREFVEGVGLGAEIDALLSDERVLTDRAHKRQRLRALRRLFRAAALEATFEQTLHAQLNASFGPELRRIRFRSSTNVEDLARLSGAGLYNSRSGCLADDLDGDEVGPSLCLSAAEAAVKQEALSRRRAELAAHPDRGYLADIIADLEGDLADEKPVSLALRRVWSSLWTERAFDERQYYGIDHRRVFMGVAVNPSFVLERANAVAVTNLAPDGRPMLVRLVSQVGEQSVVRPDDPTLVPEVLTFRVATATSAPSDVRVLVGASARPDGERVWPDAALAELARLLHIVQAHFAANVYDAVDPLSLDLEIKHTHDGRVVLKQARPFVTP